jgi:methylthioxylose transferase
VAGPVPRAYYRGPVTTTDRRHGATGTRVWPRPASPRPPFHPGTEPARHSWRDVAVWALLAAAAVLLTRVAVAAGGLADDGSAAPLAGRWDPRVGPATLLAPLVAVAVLVAVRRGVTARLRWRPLLVAGYLAALVWSLALALTDGRAGLVDPLAAPGQYLADAQLAAQDPGGFLRHFLDPGSGLSVTTRTHPPLPVLLLAGLRAVGLSGPGLGLLITAVGCLAVPLVAVAVRSLCHEAAGRALLPLLVLAPWALWTAVSMDAVVAALCAAALACGVIGCEHGRRGWWQTGWALGAGVLLGVAVLFSYAVAWLAVSLLAIYFARRTWLLGPVTALGALLPLALVSAQGFSWAAGLTSAHQALLQATPDGRWWGWAAADVAVLLLACGPALVASARGIRRTPGWPFLVGAGLAVGFSVLSGLARGDVERSWLPLFPWLVVAAVAPHVRPPARAVPGPPSGGAAAPPVVVASGVSPLALAVGAAVACVVAALVRSPW